MPPEIDEVNLTLPAPGGFASPSSTNPLTGQPLAPSRLGLRPVVVCINNDIAARPQFGISQADVMYEFLMEGFSLTRFSGVFYGADSEEIGPVRSARLINYYMGALFDAGVYCSGASDGVRYQLKNNNSLFPYLDLDLDDPESTRYARSVGNDYRTRLRTSSEMLRLLAGRLGRRAGAVAAGLYLWQPGRRRVIRHLDRDPLSFRHGQPGGLSLRCRQPALSALFRGRCASGQ